MAQTNTSRVLHAEPVHVLELQQLAEARDALDHAGQSDVPHARLAVQIAAESARDAGCAWSQIGDVLGIARGNAYQRYRRRPQLQPPTAAPPL
jgi:hypothetical protein